MFREHSLCWLFAKVNDRFLCTAAVNPLMGDAYDPTRPKLLISNAC
jgi:hypothetical protein